MNVKTMSQTRQGTADDQQLSAVESSAKFYRDSHLLQESAHSKGKMQTETGWGEKVRGTNQRAVRKERKPGHLERHLVLFLHVLLEGADRHEEEPHAEAPEQQANHHHRELEGGDCVCRPDEVAGEDVLGFTTEKDYTDYG